MSSRCTTPHARHPGLLFVLAVPVLLLPSAAFAAKKHKSKPVTPEVQGCIDAYKKAQASAKDAHLRAAKDSLAQCTRPYCPAIMRQECTNRYMQLDSDIPSVIPVVTDDGGTPRSLVEVRMDGELLTSKLDGHALPVDPGKHEFSFSTDAGPFAKKSVMIVQGQRNRPISVVFHSGKKGAGGVAVSSEGATPEEGAAKTEEGGGAPAAEAKAAETKTAEAEASNDNDTTQATDNEEAAPRVTATKSVRRTTSAGSVSRSPGVFTYVTAGLGVAGVAGYFLLNTWGKKDNDMLSSCAAAGNLCPPASVDHVHKLYVGANISGGVGLALLATSAFLYYRSQTAEEVASSPAPIKHPTRTASLRSIDLQTVPSGAVATIGGSF